jgi:hypothetical protein
MAINNSTQRHTISRCTKSLKYTRGGVYFFFINFRAAPLLSVQAGSLFSRAPLSVFREQRGDTSKEAETKHQSKCVRQRCCIMKCISRRAAHSSLSWLRHISFVRSAAVILSPLIIITCKATRCCVNNRS